jgi:hypothetical protein
MHCRHTVANFAMNVCDEVAISADVLEPSMHDALGLLRGDFEARREGDD